MFVFREIWHTLFSCNTDFEIRSFVLLPTKCCQWLSRKLVVLLLVLSRVSLGGSICSKLVGFTTVILLTATPILVHRKWKTGEMYRIAICKQQNWITASNIFKIN